MSRPNYAQQHARDAALEARENRTTVSALLQAFGPRDEGVAGLLREQGPLARALPGYRCRPQQLELAQLVANALRLRKVAIAEAPTATGKTFGTLVPVLAHLAEQGGRVLFCTASNALLDQLSKSDLPFLQQHLGIPFEWAVLKGRGRYACAAKLAETQLAFDEDVEHVNRWATRTETGDLDELPMDIHSQRYLPLKAQLVADDDECTGKKCDFYDDCHYYRARNRAEVASVVVTNHSLFAQSLLRPNLLPKYDVLVVDEAHQLARYVESSLEVILSAGRVGKTLKKIGKLFPAIQLEQLRQDVKAFFRFAYGYIRRRLNADESRLRLRPEKMGAEFVQLSEQLEHGLVELADAIRRTEGKTPRQQSRGEVLLQALRELEEAVRSVRQPNEHNVLWAELVPAREPGEDPHPVLKSTPLSVAGWLRRTVWAPTSRPRIPCILVSATLATEYRTIDSFKYAKHQLGLDTPLELQLDSPFNYPAQVLYHLPRVDGRPQREGKETHQQWAEQWARAIAPHIREVVLATRGRCFVLFSTTAAMRIAFGLVTLPYPVRCQGQHGKQDLIAWFKRTPHAVLFATKSFWEGVDVPGQALSAVIMDRIPFPDASHPVEEVRKEKMGFPRYFALEMIPRAVTELKQGAGRLIRRETDRGLLVVLDNRIHTKQYGPGILLALPGQPRLNPRDGECGPLEPASLQYVHAFLPPEDRAA